MIQRTLGKADPSPFFVGRQCSTHKTRQSQRGRKNQKSHAACSSIGWRKSVRLICISLFLRLAEISAVAKSPADFSNDSAWSKATHKSDGRLTDRHELWGLRAGNLSFETPANVRCTAATYSYTPGVPAEPGMLGSGVVVEHHPARAAQKQQLKESTVGVREHQRPARGARKHPRLVRQALAALGAGVPALFMIEVRLEFPVPGGKVRRGPLARAAFAATQLHDVAS